MIVSSSTLSAGLFGAFVLAVAWLVSDLMPPPWPCRYETLDRHPRTLALLDAARAACADGRDRASLDPAAIWPDARRRLHLFKPYHGNHAVARRIGLKLEIMACTRSHHAEWVLAVQETEHGDAIGFDLPAHWLADIPDTLKPGEPGLRVNCHAIRTP